MQKSSTIEEFALVCEVCEFIARDQEDLESINKDGSCTECYENFRYVYGKRWDSGERPSKEKARSKMYI